MSDKIVSLHLLCLSNIKSGSLPASFVSEHTPRSQCRIIRPVSGNVYNVTPYMNFHPGGVEELERGIGTDATKLFSQVHAWVNYDSILKKCLVGRYRARAGETAPSPTPSTSEGGLVAFLATNEEKERLNATQAASLPPPRKKLRWDWYEQEGRGSIVLYCQTQESSVKVTLGDDNKDLLIEVKESGDLCALHFILENSVSWPVRVIQIPNSSKIELQLTKMVPGHWKKVGESCLDPVQNLGDGTELICFSKMKVVDVSVVNYNTKIISLRYLDQSVRTTPVGHHVRVRTTIAGQEVERCYTPICKSMVETLTEEDEILLYLMVKEYKGGLLSSWLAGRPKDSIIEVSSTEGSFQTSCLSSRKELYLFAAGTGFTPMVGVINWARKAIIGKYTKISLIFFNRKENDILWRDELDKLAQKDERFSVTHILSEADESWTGLRGRMNGELLQSHLPSRDPQQDPKYYVLVCGPVAFTQLTQGLLKVIGFSEGDFHCFQG